MPHWEGLKSKPEANNHKGDASKKLDKVLRTLQQKVLSLMRLYPIIHQHLQDEEDMKEEAADQGVQQLGQQFWALLAQLEQAILLERKKDSLPGSIKPEGPVLFDDKELRAEPKGTPENQKRNFRNFSFASSPAFPATVLGDSTMSHFPTCTGYRGTKFRPWRPSFKGKSKGYGTWGAFGSYGGGSKGRGRGKGGKGKPCTGHPRLPSTSRPSTEPRFRASGPPLCWAIVPPTRPAAAAPPSEKGCINTHSVYPKKGKKREGKSNPPKKVQWQNQWQKDPQRSIAKAWSPQ